MRSRFTLSILMMLCLGIAPGLSPGLHAQERTVTGTVTSSEDGETLPGVSILVENTTSGTVPTLMANTAYQFLMGAVS